MQKTVRYRDFYGCTASSTPTRDGRYRLKMRPPHSILCANKVYNTFRGARVALGKLSDCWEEVAPKCSRCS